MDAFEALYRQHAPRLYALARRMAGSPEEGEDVRAKGVKTHGLDLSTVSGDLVVTDVTSDRLSMRSVSGGMEYTGVHSGTVHVTITGDTGFDLTANTFSGSIRSDVAFWATGRSRPPSATAALSL